MTHRRYFLYAVVLSVAPVFPRMIPLSTALAVENPSPADRFAMVEKRQRPLLTCALREKGLVYGAPVFLRAFKESEELELWVHDGKTRKFVLFKTYPIRAASGKLGPKRVEGDRQVPEGFYAFGRAGLNPQSDFHLSFNIGYPNGYDRHHERSGTFIMVHGNAVSIGCLAMGDPAIEEIYTLVDAALSNGQPFVRAHLFPFRFTDDRMAAAGKNADETPWLSFWQNLREGYDAFEKRRVPPEADLDPASGAYRFR